MNVNEVQCIVCNSSTSFVDEIEGYIEGSSYKIFQCNFCNMQFANGKTDNLDLVYDSIYKYSTKINGYSQYSRFYDEIQFYKGRYAIQYLINNEDTYKYVYGYLLKRDFNRSCKILEIGSGLGYFTYALSQDGFNVKGMDLSKDAVDKSIQAFGNIYINKNISDIRDTFDIVIATAVIEHLLDPVNFIHEIKTLLNPNGEIIVVTPRKYSEQIYSTWQTELPPIHLSWFTKSSLILLGQSVGLEFFEIDVVRSSVVYKSFSSPRPTLNQELYPIHKYQQKLRLKTILLSLSPFFLKYIYYGIFKKTSISMSSLHTSIFCIYKFKG